MMIYDMIYNNWLKLYIVVVGEKYVEKEILIIFIKG